jgi:hypothetical protein
VLPPLSGAAVNVTEVPEQIGPEGLAEIVTLGVTLGLTIILNDSEVGGFIHPNNGVRVRVAVPVNPGGGVHVAFIFAGSEKVPPISDDHIISVVPFTIAAPRSETVVP